MIHLWIRPGVRDWGDRAEVQAQLRANLVAPVAMWDRTLALPWHEFRRRVREIAEANLAQVRGVDRATDWEAVPAGDLVLPADDDDWFAPEVAEHVAALERPQLQCIRWRASFLEVAIRPKHQVDIWRRQLFPRSRTRYACSSNNYAIRPEAGAQERADNHLVATDWFHTLAQEERGWIERRLSLHNRTLGSITSLWFSKDERGLLRRLERYRRLYDRPLPAGTEWAQPYAERIAQLTEELVP